MHRLLVLVSLSSLLLYLPALLTLSLRSQIWYVLILLLTSLRIGIRLMAVLHTIATLLLAMVLHLMAHLRLNNCSMLLRISSVLRQALMKMVTLLTTHLANYKYVGTLLAVL